VAGGVPAVVTASEALGDARRFLPTSNWIE